MIWERLCNNMFDANFNESFSPKDSEYPNENLDKWFNNGTFGNHSGPEPIWVTNESAGAGRKSGVAMWPGSTAKIHGFYPHKLLLYNKTTPQIDKIDKMMQWMTDENEPVNLCLMYVNEPDSTGHRFGPDSQEVSDVIVKLDGVVGYLMEQLKKHKLDSTTDVIILSDHGMQEITNVTYTDMYVNSSRYHAFGSSPIFSIIPAENESADALVEDFNKVPHLTAYHRKDIPREYFYTYNVRILPILIVANDSWHICPNKEQCYLLRGNHGFSNKELDMHPIFMAQGPSFRKNFTVRPFNNVDIYPLLCYLLDITAAPNNGSMDTVITLLVVDQLTVIDVVVISIVMCMVLFGLIFSLVTMSKRQVCSNKDEQTVSVSEEEEGLLEEEEQETTNNAENA